MIRSTRSFDPLSIDRRLSSVSFYTYLLLISLSGALLLSLHLKESRLWLDEIFSMFLIQDPSFSHMNEAVRSGVETSPPLFFSVYWLLGHHVSADPLFLKTVSTGLFLLTVVILFRYVNLLIRNPALNFLIFITAICFTDLDYVNSGQIRSYSFYLLVSCLHFITMHRLIKDPAKPFLLICQMLTGLALVFIHNFGLFIVAVPASVFVFLFWATARKEYLLPLLSTLMIFAGWALVWYDNFLVQANLEGLQRAAGSHTVVTFFQTLGALIPTVGRLEAQWPWLAVVRVMGVVGLFMIVVIRQFNLKKFISDPVFSFYILSGYVFIAISLAALLVSRYSIPVLINHYLWPVHLLVIYQLVYAVQFLQPRFRISVRYTFFVIIYTSLVSLYLFNKNRNHLPGTGREVAAVGNLPENYPVFCESMQTFLPIAYQNAGDVKLWLDGQTLVGNKKTPEYRRLEIFYSKYPSKAVVWPTQFSKKSYPRFYVLTEGRTNKFEALTAEGKLRIEKVLPTRVKDVRLLECVYN